MATARSTRYNKVIAPRLLAAPMQYDAQYQEQYTNALRLYFNQLDSLTGTLVGNLGGKFINNPYGAVQRTTNKTFAANTATLITFDQTDYLNGVTNNTSDGLHVEQAGIYNYQFSVQLKNTDTQIRSAWIWLRLNGVDIAGTASKFDVTSSHGGIPGYVIAAANFYVQMNANDYVEMWAAADDVAVSFDAAAAQTSPFAMPSIPSVVATLSFVSALTA